MTPSEPAPTVGALLRNSSARLDHMARQLEAHGEVHCDLQDMADRGAEWVDIRQASLKNGHPYFVKQLVRPVGHGGLSQERVTVGRPTPEGWMSAPGFPFTHIAPGSDENKVWVYTT